MNPTANAGDRRDTGLIPGSGRCPGGGHGNPLQYSCLENLTDRGAWQATVHGVAKSWTWLKQHSTHRWKESQKQLLKVNVSGKKYHIISERALPPIYPLGTRWEVSPLLGTFCRYHLQIAQVPRLLFDLPYLLNSEGRVEERSKKKLPNRCFCLRWQLQILS